MEFPKGSLVELAHGDRCENCRRPKFDFPMAFRQDPYCSDNCRKALGLDYPKR